MPASAPPTRLRRVLRWATFILPLVILVGAGIVVLLIFTRPAWYQPVSIDFNRLRADKRDLVGRVDDVGAALNQRRAITVTIDEAQANRWLAARHELWPDATFELQGVEDPFVQFLDGIVRLAGTVDRDGWQAVLSLDVGIAVDAETVALELLTARLGRFPIGGKQVLQRLDLGDLSAAVRGDDGRTLRFDNAWVWPNGKRPYRIETLDIKPGKIVITLRPR